MQTQRRRCLECRFFYAFTVPGTGRALAQCRYSAPVVHPVHGSTVWPLVQPTFGCGQWDESDESRQLKAARRRAYDRGCPVNCGCPQCQQDGVGAPRQP